jgi:hypothetical protein
MNYQKAYGDKIGTAKLDIKKAVAGEHVDCRLTYTIGELGIDDSGSMKVLFRIVTDAGNPQFEVKKGENFVKITSTNKKLEIHPGLRSSGMYGKVYERPWSKGFTLNFGGASLSKGDKVYIDFKNWRIQTFYEETFEFKILVDPFATARYIELLDSPVIKVLPGKPESIKVIAPTQVKTNESFDFLIRVDDKWGNPCRNMKGSFRIEDNPLFEDLPKNINFKAGRAKVKTKLTSEDTAYITATYNNLKGRSNPITGDRKLKNNRFWGDLHGQSEETVGTNDIDAYFNFAKKYSFLDICAHQGNDFQITNDFWKKINRTTEKFTKDGNFIVIPGYEWSGNTPIGGDRNVLYLNEGEQIYRSSHALIDEFKDIKTDAKDVNELFKKLKNKKAITIAHVGGRYSNLDFHDEILEPTIEVHSDWGTFEWFLFEALKKGYKVGVVANSDGHQGRPGSSRPSYAHFNSYGGLTCFVAKNLTRKEIFKAIRKRHTYATTGARIDLDVKVQVNDKNIFVMGDDVGSTKKDKIALLINYRGTSPLDRLEIYNKDEIIHAYYPEIKQNKGKTVKIIWGGSKVKGRRRAFDWGGGLQVKDANIESLKKINFYNKNNWVEKNKNILNWKGMTTGGIQGLVLHLSEDNGNINIDVNEEKISLAIPEIVQTSRVYDMGGLDAQLEIYQTTPDNKPQNLDLIRDIAEHLKKGINPIYIKVVQKDGHMAWTSPLYINY